jgi:SAM-dependent methyltransferase
LMDVKGTLKTLTLDFRRELEGKYDAQGTWQAGDLERRLAAIGVRRDRASVPIDELPHLASEDREARRVVDAFLESRAESGQSREAAFAEFVRDAAYTWANRLLALRCMEARALIDEVILQKDAYGGRSLQHNRLANIQPERCAGEDEGLFAAFFDEFSRRAEELPLLFDPRALEVALRPSVAVLKRCVALLSGTLAVKGQEAATDEVFTAPDALGWTYQYWNTEEKDRVFEKVRNKKGSKIEGAEIIPATCIYTEPYMVKFLVQNSLGAIWMGTHPDCRLSEKWEYYVRDADRAPTSKKSVSEITFLDPACGSGHFLIEAFELFYGMYLEEGAITEPAKICAAILERNLYGIDIDERAVQIAAIALVMKAKEKAPDFVPHRVNLVATNIRVPVGKEHLEAFLRKHPEDASLKPALLAIFEGLAHVDELGSLLQIEEPVEKELRALKTRYEASGSPMEQRALWGEFQKPVQGKLPIGIASYQAWKDGALARIREHFDAEARDIDLGTAFFGEAARKGLSLVDLLARRYDVVAANPPYMGSKNMGPVLKRYVERHFSAGKRDLYAAFILRCHELVDSGGRVAMVTQQSWMFLNSYSALRALGDEKRRTEPNVFGGVLHDMAVEALAHLGRYAFSEIGNAAVAPVLFVLRNVQASDQHRLWACRLTAPRESNEQAALLRGATAANRSPLVSRPAQASFLSVPESPICYWLRARFVELLGGRTLGDVSNVCQGLATADDGRFVRFVWELRPDEWAKPVSKRRWVPLEKGGGYGKWFGHHFWTVDWEHGGARIKAFPTSVVRNEQQYFQGGWTYSYMAQGSLALRQLEAGGVFSHLASAVFFRDLAAGGASTPNCRFASAIIRSLSAKMQLNESYVSRVPVPRRTDGDLPAIQSSCVALKRWLVARDPAERTFTCLPPEGLSFVAAHGVFTERAEAVAATLHTLEGVSERKVFSAYSIRDEDLSAVLDETGTPAGWFPLITGCDAPPTLPEGLSVSPDLPARVSQEPRRTLPGDDLATLTRRLRALYESGPGVAPAEENGRAPENGEEDERDNVPASGARIPIPDETFIEELSQKLEIHPISVYWLLREMREKEGLVSGPELGRFVQNYLVVLVLRLLGHRWPCEVEAGEAPPAWADAHGIIPITEGTGEPTLLARVEGRLAEDFGAKRVRAIELELQEIVGKSLPDWLATDFFKRHVSQFKKRPIAWQIESLPRGSGKRQGRRAARRAPAFSCFVYYHQLNADLLPKVRTQYVGPLCTSVQTELGILDRLNNRTADQDARRIDLEQRLAELKSFDARIELAISGGFTSDRLEELVVMEPLDRWISRDGCGSGPSSRDALLALERKYIPDLNDGVRVNIAPLQRAGLLAADVLAAKDLEKAIADRAEWRADERRWCREGKLPRPGWWPNQELAEADRVARTSPLSAAGSDRR